MTLLDREMAYIRRNRPEASKGNSMAMLNVAAAYRIMGKPRLSFKWFQRASQHHDGSGLLEVGYCYHVGLGVRHNYELAETSYRAAISNSFISAAEREEAMYFLAVLLSQHHGNSRRSEVISLLHQASHDKDYPQAMQLLSDVVIGQCSPYCLCRRYLKKNLAVKKCTIHRL